MERTGMPSFRIFLVVVIATELSLVVLYVNFSTLYPCNKRNGENFRDLATVEFMGSDYYCPNVPPAMKNEHKSSSESVIIFPFTDYIEVEEGATIHTPGCISTQKIAVIVPCRKGDRHLLKTFLGYIHPFLQKQEIDYALFVIEQDQENMFHRGAFMNAGFLEALRQGNFTCFIFHDVDLIPESNLNIYACSNYPRHMSSAVRGVSSASNNLKDDDRRIDDHDSFDGVYGITKDQMLAVNGFSNKHIGEADDIFQRFQQNGYTIYRNTESTGKYRRIDHSNSTQTKPTQQSIQGSCRSDSSLEWKKDGLSSISTMYKILTTERRKLYTYILVHIQTMYDTI